MANIKKKPVLIEEGIKVRYVKDKMVITGPKGSITLAIPDRIKPEIDNNQISLTAKANSKDKSLVGLYYSLIRNAVQGVKTGWRKTLELKGVGFRADSNGQELNLNVGFSHPVILTAPQDISFQVVENKIIVQGIDKYLVGEIAATIRRVKPPEPYKGKGIKYLDEVVRKKAGKAAKTVGALGVK